MLKTLALKVRGIVSYSLYLPLLPLMPIILMQGKRVKANTLRLPEAKGIRYSLVNQNYNQNLDNSSDQKSLLHIGESTVAGVGVESIEQGFTSNIAQVLPWGCSWQALGHNGASIADINCELKEFDLKVAADIVLVTMGVNDTTSLTSIKSWQQGLAQCIDQALEAVDKPANVYFTQVPPMHCFPALPFPLNRFLGLRAWQLDNALKQLCLLQRWTHLKTDMPLEKEWMARDGYHPNDIGYQKWAQAVAKYLES